MIFIFTLIRVHAIDKIPEKISDWTEKGIVLKGDKKIDWENKGQTYLEGIAKKGDTYYLYYKAGFDGCWNAHGDINHMSIGLATSKDGVNFKRHPNNPIMIPHQFVPVSSHEEGIRSADIRYVPEKKLFYAFMGVESPGGKNSCKYMAPKGKGCACNVQVDSKTFLATSEDGVNWTNKGEVKGTYAKSGGEVYPSSWVYAKNKFHLYVTTAEDIKGNSDNTKSFSSGANPLNLSEKGYVPQLNFGWSQIDMFLHDDKNTVTLIYDPKNPKNTGHPGANNNNLYFATVDLSNPRVIKNERVVQKPKEVMKFHAILKDGNEWKWYYSSETGPIRLRTHSVSKSTLIENHQQSSPEHEFYYKTLELEKYLIDGKRIK